MRADNDNGMWGTYRLSEAAVFRAVAVAREEHKIIANGGEIRSTRLDRPRVGSRREAAGRGLGSRDGNISVRGKGTLKGESKMWWME